MQRQAICLLFVSAMLTGCGSRMSDKELIEKVTGSAVKTTVPVAGTITVDGEPQKGVVVTLYTTDDKKVPGAEVVFTDRSGKFQYTTYKSGDGIEPGEYKLTFEWLKPKKDGGEFEGPDKLKGRYSNPAKSEFKLLVETGKPQTDLKYELTTK